MPDRTADVGGDPARFLRAVLFEDIVGSTAVSARVGNKRWAKLVEDHHAIVRHELRRHRGIEIDTAGDGFFAAFEAPSHAIDCAFAMQGRLRTIGIDTRAGIHAGECEIVAGKIGGITVTIGARIGAHAGGNEVVVSQAVRDALVGTSYVFVPSRRVALKGVPDEWLLYAVEAPRASDGPAD